MNRPLRIALFIGRFPVVSETFILRQVTGLLDLGHEVDVYADEGEAPDAPAHPEVAKYRLQERTTYMRMPPETYPYEMPLRPLWGQTWPPGSAIPVSNLRRLWRAGAMFWRGFTRAPRLAWRTLRTSEFGYQAESLSALYRLAGFASARRPYDILHAHYGPVGNSYRFAPQLRRAPFLVSFYGYDCWAVPRKEGPGVYTRLFQTAHRVLILAEVMGRQLQALGCPAAKLRKLPVGVRMGDFEFRERGLQDNEPVRLLTIARFVEKKGLEFALRAFAQVRQKHPELEYHLVGDGPLRPRIEKLLQEIQLQDAVVLHGFCESNRVRELMAKSHILVLSSVTAADGDQECTPVSLMDAQAAGLPVLSTRHSGIPEVVPDGQSGFLVPEADVPALAERLQFLVEHAEIWPALGRAGRRHIEQNYNCEILSQRTVELYREALGEFRAVSYG
jgi:colanic acid/amylovoran/stewartan biosynthesis glycosyltransferase WcaL/AmsK/CpsK